MALLIYFLNIIIFALFSTINSLQPRESLYREVKSLDGIWLFKICDQHDQDIGFRNQWYKMKLEDVRSK